MTSRLDYRSLALAALALVVVAPAAAAPPPRPAGYAKARAEVTADGRSLARLVVAGDAKAIRARFTPKLARAIPLSEVERVLRETRDQAPIGARLGETALPGRQGGIYIADHRWGAQKLALQASLTHAGRIASISLSPRQPLPPDPNATRPLRARLSLPFRGEWWVVWGGPTERQNYHAIAADQRHALDLLAWKDGSTSRGAGTRNADYYAWGRPILAPADARVVAAVDGVRDNRPQVETSNMRSPAGNHVVLDLGNGEFALLAHLQRGSVRVRAGQRVKRGTVLGLCGNSGNSSEPHLHFHVQDRAQLFTGARGLPLAFEGYRADGRPVMRGAPVQGQFLRPA